MAETREQIIGLADELIRERGFNAFSYSDISEPLGIRNSAVHYHFPTKADLGEAVVDAELERVAGFRRELGGLPGDEQLKQLVSVFYKSSKLRLICLMGSLTPDYNTFEEPLRGKVGEMCKEVLSWVTEALGKAREEGRLRFEGEARDRALLVISSLLSSLLLSRVLGKETFQRMLDQVLQDLGAAWRIKDI
ncbi:MAG: TetR/AcrR family transcriptional regulator [Bacteroidetes bacterium]|nr:TetR/AcrR family transcriptional regulator [Bacteroidota bacterium]